MDDSKATFFRVTTNMRNVNMKSVCKKHEEHGGHVGQCAAKAQFFIHKP